MGIADHVTCLLQNPYAGQEATVKSRHGTTTVPNWERSTSRLYIVTLLFNLYAECIMQNAGLGETQAGIKTAGRNIRYADDTTLRQKAKRPLDESERGE